MLFHGILLTCTTVSETGRGGFFVPGDRQRDAAKLPRQEQRPAVHKSRRVTQRSKCARMIGTATVGQPTTGVDANA